MSPTPDLTQTVRPDAKALIVAVTPGERDPLGDAERPDPTDPIRPGGPGGVPGRIRPDDLRTRLPDGRESLTPSATRLQPVQDWLLHRGYGAVARLWVQDGDLGTLQAVEEALRTVGQDMRWGSRRMVVVVRLDRPRLEVVPGLRTKRPVLWRDRTNGAITDFWVQGAFGRGRDPRASDPQASGLPLLGLTHERVADPTGDVLGLPGVALEARDELGWSRLNSQIGAGEYGIQGLAASFVFELCEPLTGAQVGTVVRIPDAQDTQGWPRDAECWSLPQSWPAHTVMRSVLAPIAMNYVPQAWEHDAHKRFPTSAGPETPPAWPGTWLRLEDTWAGELGYLHVEDAPTGNQRRMTWYGRAAPGHWFEVPQHELLPDLIGPGSELHLYRMTAPPDLSGAPYRRVDHLLTSG